MEQIVFQYPKVCVLFDCVRPSEYQQIVLGIYRSSLEGICPVIAVIHDPTGQSEDPTLGESITLGDEEIFQGTAHSKNIIKGIIPGNCDLKVLAAVRRLNKFDCFIRIEYDVLCTYDPRSALARLVEICSKHDYVASFISPWKESDSKWMWWKSLELPAKMHITLPQDAFRAFLPLMSGSRRYFEAYTDALANGLTGHEETTTATVACTGAFSTYDLATGSEAFTAYPQFNVKQSLGLDVHIPPFIHPIKDLEQFKKLPDSITKIYISDLAIETT